MCLSNSHMIHECPLMEGNFKSRQIVATTPFSRSIPKPTQGDWSLVTRKGRNGRNSNISNGKLSPLEGGYGLGNPFSATRKQFVCEGGFTIILQAPMSQLVETLLALMPHSASVSSFGSIFLNSQDTIIVHSPSRGHEIFQSCGGWKSHSPPSGSFQPKKRHLLLSFRKPWMVFE